VERLSLIKKAVEVEALVQWVALVHQAMVVQAVLV
jgi:hypothetical protein